LLSNANGFFRTGSTGYIGGSVLSKLVATHSNIEITALQRSPSQEFTEKYPKITIVKGTFDDFKVIENAARNSDIVLRKPSVLASPVVKVTNEQQIVETLTILAVPRLFCLVFPQSPRRAI
jgi:hypothetical protein